MKVGEVGIQNFVNFNMEDIQSIVGIFDKTIDSVFIGTNVNVVNIETGNFEICMGMFRLYSIVVLKGIEGSFMELNSGIDIVLFLV